MCALTSCNLTLNSCLSIITFGLLFVLSLLMHITLHEHGRATRWHLLLVGGHWPVQLHGRSHGVTVDNVALGQLVRVLQFPQSVTFHRCCVLISFMSPAPYNHIN